VTDILETMWLPEGTTWRVHMLGPDEAMDFATYAEAKREADGINRISVCLNEGAPLEDKVVQVAYVAPVIPHIPPSASVRVCHVSPDPQNGGVAR